MEFICFDILIGSQTLKHMVKAENQAPICDSKRLVVHSICQAWLLEGSYSALFELCYLCLFMVFPTSRQLCTFPYQTQGLSQYHSIHLPIPLDNGLHNCELSLSSCCTMVYTEIPSPVIRSILTRNQTFQMVHLQR